LFPWPDRVPHIAQGEKSTYNNLQKFTKQIPKNPLHKSFITQANKGYNYPVNEAIKYTDTNWRAK